MTTTMTRTARGIGLEPVKQYSMLRRALLETREFLKPLKLFFLCLSQFLDAVNVSGVNIALPAIALQLGMNAADETWVLAAYSISIGSLMLITGRLGDMFGFRNMFTLGTAVFCAWSIVCGATSNTDLFLVSRAMQGVGAAATIPNGLALIAANYEGKTRERAIGVYGISTSLGLTLGLIVGGLFSYYVGYQWLFYFSAIIAGAQALVSFIIIPDDRETNMRLQAQARGGAASQASGGGSIKSELMRFDFLGAVLITVALVFLVFFLNEGNSVGWNQPINIAFIILCVVFVALFIPWQIYKGRDALMPVRIWLLPNFTPIMLILFFCGCNNPALFYYTEMWELVRGVDALHTAIQFIPIGLSVLVATPIAVILLPRVGSRWVLLLGAVVGIIGTVLATYINSDIPYWNIPFVSLILTNASIGFVLYVGMLTGTNSSPPEWRGVISALLNVAFQIGTGVTLSIASAVASATSNTNLLTTSKNDLIVGFHNAFYAVMAMMCIQFFIAPFVRDIVSQPNSESNGRVEQPRAPEDIELTAVAAAASTK